MNAATCLKKLQLVGVLSFATVDKNGAPQIRCISAIHYEPTSLYFFTARGKAFCDELLSDGRVQILGYTRFKEMIRLSGRAVPAENQRQKIDTIFSEQPYLANVYPGDTRDIGIIFEVQDIEIEYFNLGVNPIFRESYTFGFPKTAKKGYYVTKSCIGCETCVPLCPQKSICVTEGKAKIQQEHCLHCGHCYEHCPANAIEKRA